MSRVIPMIYVEDVFRTVRFYEEAVGGVCDHADDDGSYAELRLGSVTLGLVAISHARRYFPGEFRRHELAEPPPASSSMSKWRTSPKRLRAPSTLAPRN